MADERKEMDGGNTTAAPVERPGERAAGYAEGPSAEYTRSGSRADAVPGAEYTRCESRAEAVPRTEMISGAETAPGERPGERASGCAEGPRRGSRAEAVPGAEYPRCGSRMERVSRALSAALHPFFVPVYAMAVFMFADPLLSVAPTRLKLFLWAMIVVVALLIPAFSIALLRALRLISGFSIGARRDRTIPLAIVALSYGLCIVMVADITWGFIVRRFLIAAFCCAVCALAVTPAWKISLHMIPAGAVCGIFAVLAVAGIGAVFAPLSVSLLLSGMLASSRLYLGRHTPAQVAAGFFLGLAVAAAAMLFIR